MSELGAGAAVLLLVLVPGAATVVALGSDLAEKLDLDTTERLLLLVWPGAVLTGWISLVLATFGIFSFANVAIPVAIYSLAVPLSRRHQLSSLSPSLLRPGRDALPLLVALMLAGAVFLRPFEYVVGGLDPGVYVQTGANIARTGAILIDDALVRDLDEASRELLFGQELGPLAVVPRHSGFYLRDAGGTVEPHGFHLLPAWMALFHSLGGLSASLYTVPSFALLALLGTYAVGRRLLHPGVGLLAAVLLGASVVQQWFGRYPAAEILVQVLFLLGLWGLALALRASSRGLAALAGVTFGMIHLTKIELLVVPFVLGLALAWLGWRGSLRAPHAWFAAGYAAMGVHAFVHASAVASVYAPGVMRNVLAVFSPNPGVPTEFAWPWPWTLTGVLFAANWRLLVALLVVGAVGVGVHRLAGAAVRRRFATSLGQGRKMRVGWAVLLMGGLGYAYFVRPALGPSAEAPWVLSFLQAGDVDRMVKMSWVLTPVGAILAAIGLFRLVSKDARGVTWLMLSCGLAQIALLLYDGFITPAYFWAARRELPILLPVAMICISWAIWSTWRRRRGLVGWLAPGVLSVAALSAQVLPSLPFVGHTEYQGITPQLAELAGSVPPEAVLLFEWSPEAERLAGPLQYLYGRSGFTVPDHALDDSRLRELVDAWVREERPVYWVATARHKLPVIPGYSLEHVAARAVVTTEAEITEERLPRAAGYVTAPLDLYQIAERGRAEWRDLGSAQVTPNPAAGVIDLDGISPNPAGYWTMAEANATLPACQASELAIIVRLAGGRPFGVPPARVSLYLDSAPIGQVVVGNSPRTYVVHAPGDPGRAGDCQLRLESSTWSPGPGVDLGVRWSEVAVRGRP